jgi:cell division protein FtsX
MIVVAFVASTWCIAGGMWALGTWRDADERASMLSIDVVCEDDSTESHTRKLATMIARKQGVLSSDVISSEQAWREFSRDMKIVDDNLQSVANLPSFVRVRLDPRHVSTHRVERFVAEVRGVSTHKISSIAWSRSYVAMVDDVRQTLMMFGGAAGILSFVLFVVAVSYAFKAEVHRAGSDLRVAELLGAPVRWIAAPHLLVGLIAGVVGLLLSLSVLVYLQSSMQHLASWIRYVEVQEVGYAAGVLAAIGLGVSWTQSVMAVREAMRHR